MPLKCSTGQAAVKGELQNWLNVNFNDERSYKTGILIQRFW